MSETNIPDIPLSVEKYIDALEHSETVLSEEEWSAATAYLETLLTTVQPTHDSSVRVYGQTNCVYSALLPDIAYKNPHAVDPDENTVFGQVFYTGNKEQLQHAIKLSLITYIRYGKRLVDVHENYSLGWCGLSNGVQIQESTYGIYVPQLSGAAQADLLETGIPLDEPLVDNVWRDYLQYDNRFDRGRLSEMCSIVESITEQLE